jgi:hypothetical protein
VGEDPGKSDPTIPAPDPTPVPDPAADLHGFEAVDRLKKMQELMSPRTTAPGSKTRFAESIRGAILLHEREEQWSLGGNEALFGLVDESKRVAVSLASHPLCEQSVSSLRSTIGHEVAESVAEKANELSKRWNALRADAAGLRRLQSRLMGCLAYSESLTTADGPRSQEVARLRGPEGYLKPAGVKFYLDAAQTNPDSELNIGLYQFSPVSGGNIQSCIRSWNMVHAEEPELQLDRRADSATMIRRLGNAAQDFNAFCGVDKIAQIFFVQVNTLVARRTHPSNVIQLADGTLSMKEPQDRCVSLHFNSRAYNHFGPLQNSTRRNLSELLSCALDIE